MKGARTRKWRILPWESSETFVSRERPKPIYLRTTIQYIAKWESKPDTHIWSWGSVGVCNTKGYRRYHFVYYSNPFFCCIIPLFLSSCCRLSVMSSWLSSLCECPATTMVAPGQVQAVAAVIWKAKHTESESIVTRKFSETLFRCVAVLTKLLVNCIKYFKVILKL